MTAPTPRHILMTCDAVGGVWTYALDLAEGLLAQDIAVTLAVIGPAPSAGQRQRAEDLAGLALFEIPLPLDWTDEATPASIRRAGERVADLAHEVGAELVHLNSPALVAEVAFPVPVLGACHSCLATWWDAVKGGELPETFRWRTALLRKGYERCDRLVAPSRAFARATEARYGLPVLAVHNGRTPLPFKSGERRAVAVASGRLWDEGKNLAALDRAAARCRHPVVAAGSLKGPNGAAIALPHIECLGQLDAPALADLLCGSAAYVSTALYEPFGLGVLEAAQAGCALVLSDRPGFRELWDGAALFVDPFDDVALAGTLDVLLDDPARSAALGGLARARSAAYGVDAMVGSMIGVYRSLAGASAAPKEAAA